MRDLQVTEMEQFCFEFFFGGERTFTHEQNKINIIGDNFGYKSSVVA